MARSLPTSPPLIVTTNSAQNCPPGEHAQPVEILLPGHYRQWGSNKTIKIRAGWEVSSVDRLQRSSYCIFNDLQGSPGELRAQRGLPGGEEGLQGAPRGLL